MTIDSSRINLSERDIEDYLFDHPGEVFGDGARWIKRQFAVPGGIIDLIGQTESGRIVVVEVKNVAIDSSALAQVCRYAYDINEILSTIEYRFRTHELEIADVSHPPVFKMVIGRSVDTKTKREAEALDVYLLTFETELHLNISYRSNWETGFEGERAMQYEILSDDDDLYEALCAHKKRAFDNFQKSLTEYQQPSPSDQIVSERDFQEILIESA